MIILEGPDGSGKSLLADKLCAEFDLPIHQRASDSLRGPVANLFDWAYGDVVSMPEQPLSIYNRHPLISEYVYGTICRTKLSEGFVSTTAHNLIRMMAARVLVVMCRPPRERLVASVSPERDMPGVYEHIERIDAAYDVMKMFWPGKIITHNYVDPESLPRVISTCRIFVADIISTKASGRSQ